MNPQDSADWIELSRLWQSEGATVTRQDIDDCFRQQRRHLLAVRLAEFAGTAAGVAAALWLAFASRFFWMGMLTAGFAVSSAIVLLRVRQQRLSGATASLGTFLKESIAHQDWVDTQLRFGRALSFVALFSITMAASAQLLHMDAQSGRTLLAAATAAAGVMVALVWNLVLTRRARRHGARLEALHERFRT